MNWNGFSKIRLILLAIVLPGMLLTGCGKGLAESDVSYAGPMLDNILAGIAARDYDKFSKDFSERMKEGIPEEDFHSLVTTLEAKLGTYEGRSFDSAVRTKSAMDLMVVTYQAAYSKESDVTIKVYFSETGDRKLIEGFYIDAPVFQQ